jgi:hypothetical protein
MTEIQPWSLSHRADQNSRVIADRHYNRQKVGSRGFVPPGRCLVLRTPDSSALWVTSWPFAEYVKHEWAGAWINSLFRKESGDILASTLIRSAVAASLAKWTTPPELGIVSFVNAAKVKAKRNPGICYIHAGFTLVGETKSGLLAYQLLPSEMPEPMAAGTKAEISSDYTTPIIGELVNVRGGLWLPKPA